MRGRIIFYIFYVIFFFVCAFLFCLFLGISIFFSDYTMWRFTNFNLDRGYPKNISGMPETPRAAAFVRDQYGITRLLMYGVGQS